MPFPSIEEQERRRKERLDTGLYYRTTTTYKPRRYGSYWCARLIGFDTISGRPVYEMGETTAKHGRAGHLRVRCRPGEIIAWGQPDRKYPHKTLHRMMIMEADGRMRTITKAQAFLHWFTQHGMESRKAA